MDHELASQVWVMREALILIARDTLLLTAPRYSSPKSLVPHQAQVFSRHAQDGMVAEIFRRVGADRNTFLEIGAGDGLENNTRFLLETGWTGVWAECDPINVQAIEVEGLPGLTLVKEPIDRENVAPLLLPLVSDGLDFLSIDIDMNTHHVWEAMTDFRPRVVCVEYNSSIPPSVDYAVPYNPGARWAGGNRFGAGLKALERIGRALGYHLVGCDFLGVDAFFVRKDLCAKGLFLEPYTAEFHYEPPRYHLLNHRGHEATRRSS